MLEMDDAVKAALFSVLNGEGLSVYDTPQQDADGNHAANFPYVVIGESAEEDQSPDDSEMGEILQTIEIWSQYRGKAEANAIAKMIKDALHRQTLVVTDYEAVSVEFESREATTDSDGVTQHVLLRYRIILDSTG